MPSKRFRLRQTFWLNLLKPEEAELADTIEILKNERSFAKVIRDGIRLVNDLRKGKLDVLFELFPWVRAEFLEYMRALQPQPVADTHSMSEQLARLEKLLLEQGNVPVQSASEPGSITVTGGPKLLVVPSVAASVFDDDDVVLDIRRDGSSMDASRNFLNSVLAFAGGQ